MPEEITQERLAQAYQDRGSTLVRMLSGMLASPGREYDCVSVAEELVQEAFLRAWTHRKQYGARQGASVETWLNKIAIHAFLDYLRKQKVRGAGRHVQIPVPGDDGESAGGAIPSVKPTQESNLGYDDLMRRMKHTLRHRPSFYGETFIMENVDGCPLKEIVSITGININTLKVALYRTRLILRKSLKRS